MDTYILNIETATKNCSVSLSKNGALIGLVEKNTGNYSHAEQLHFIISELLDKNHVTLKQLNAIAVSKGPGSFTGLRIGVSAAKGLCFALNIPLLAIDSLSVLAQSKHIDKGFIIPLIDARRMEVYTSVYNSEYKQIADIEAKILEPNSFDSYLNQELVYFIGDGVEKFKAICQHPNAIFEADILPSAKDMVDATYLKYTQSSFEDVAYFEPFYLKDFFMAKSKKV